MVSPTLRNTSGFARRIVSKRRMPPREVSMPQPCPQVSADHASRTRQPGAWRGAELPHLRRADDARVGDVLEADAVEDVLACRQITDDRTRSEPGLRRGDRACHPSSVGERLRRRVFDGDSGRAIDMRPHHRLAWRGISCRDTVVDARPNTIRGDHGRRLPGPDADRDRRRGGKSADTTVKKGTAVHGERWSGPRYPTTTPGTPNTRSTSTLNPRT